MEFTDHSVISPKYSIQKLVGATIEDKIDVFEDQIQSWIIEPAKRLLSTAHADRAVLILATTYFEAVASYFRGRESKNAEREFFKAGLLAVFPELRDGPLFIKRMSEMFSSISADEITDKIADSLYSELRCGLFHIGLLRPRITITQGLCLHPVSDPETGEVRTILLDPGLFLKRVEDHLHRYAAQLRTPSDSQRANFQKLFDERFGIEPKCQPIQDRAGFQRQVAGLKTELEKLPADRQEQLSRELERESEK
jgi:hypothetical protein